jgi:hypothetical protein
MQLSKPKNILVPKLLVARKKFSFVFTASCMVASLLPSGDHTKDATLMTVESHQLTADANGPCLLSRLLQ